MSAFRKLSLYHLMGEVSEIADMTRHGDMGDLAHMVRSYDFMIKNFHAPRQAGNGLPVVL
jgi:hypothetical protein